MTLVFPYKCLICKKKFEGVEDQKNCPKCKNIFIQRTSKRGRKKITKKKIEFSGDFVEIGKKCQKCIFSEKSTNLGIGIKCGLPKPKTVFRHGQWLCYSFKIENVHKNKMGDKNDWQEKGSIF